MRGKEAGGDAADDRQAGDEHQMAFWHSAC